MKRFPSLITYCRLSEFKRETRKQLGAEPIFEKPANTSYARPVMDRRNKRKLRGWHEAGKNLE